MFKNSVVDTPVRARHLQPPTSSSRYRRALRVCFALTAAWSTVGIFGAEVATASPAKPETNASPDVSSFGVSPATIDISDAGRGGSFASEIIVFNRATKTVQFTVASIGQVGDWIRVGPEATPVKQYTFASEPGRTLVNIAIDVPTDSPNGTYEAAVTVTAQTSAAADKSGVSVSFETRVTIRVSGAQRATAVFSNLSVAASEIGRPTEIRATIANTGNVSLPLGLEARVFRSKTLVQTLTTPEQQQIAPPGRSVDVILQWPTIDALPGDYTIDVAATAGGQSLGSKQQTVRVEAPGKLVRSLKITNLEVTQQTNSRPVLRGTVTNTGDIAGRTTARATVTSTKSKNGATESPTSSESFYIAPGESLPFVVTLPLLEAGGYELKVDAELEDYRAPSVITTFVVSGEKKSAPVLTMIAAVGLLGLMFTVRRGRRRRQLPRSFGRPQPTAPEQPDRVLASSRSL